MSAFDNCLLFDRISSSETTYVLVCVDDTFIFTNHHDHLQTLITSIGKKHYEVWLDIASSSDPDGTVTLTQPKLLQKLFTLYPPRTSRLGNRTPYHPYAPEPKESDPAPQPMDTYAYLRLLGILLYLTKSRPVIKQTNRPRLQQSLLRRRIPSPHSTTGPHHLPTPDSAAINYSYTARWTFPTSLIRTARATRDTSSLTGPGSTFYNRSVKQTAVTTSSTQAEARAIFTLTRDLNYLIAHGVQRRRYHYHKRRQ